MAELTLFIRDTAGNFKQNFGPGEDWATSANEDVDNIGSFSSLRVSVLLQRPGSAGTGNIFLLVDSDNFNETVLLTAFSSLQLNNPQWFEVSFTNGPYLLELNDKVSFHIRVVGGNRVGQWMCQDFNGSTDVLVRSYGTELSAPEKPANPSPSHTGEDILVYPTLSWEAG